MLEKLKVCAYRWWNADENFFNYDEYSPIPEVVGCEPDPLMLVSDAIAMLKENERQKVIVLTSVALQGNTPIIKTKVYPDTPEGLHVALPEHARLSNSGEYVRVFLSFTVVN